VYIFRIFCKFELGKKNSINFMNRYLFYEDMLDLWKIAFCFSFLIKNIILEVSQDFRAFFCTFLDVGYRNIF